MEPFEDVVARVKRERDAAERETLEDLVMELREHTYHPWHDGGWYFDLNLDQAVERVRKFINEHS